MVKMKLYWTYDEELGWCKRSRIYLFERQANAESADGLRVDRLEVPDTFALATRAYGVFELIDDDFILPRLLWLTREEALDALGVDWQMIEEFEIL